MSEPTAFDPCGPLPKPGVTVLEASAGTGKTCTLTTLVARYVAEGVPLPSILAVTFTRMATGELRERVRERLSEALRLFDDPPSDPDALSGILTGGSPDAVDTRRRLLRNALAEFDAATIATTHGFCHTVLRELGTAGSTAPGAILLEDPTDMIQEVVEDLYLRRALLHGTPPFGVQVARRAALEATRNPDTRVVPAPSDEPAGLLARLAAAARDEVSRRLMEEGLLTYDNLLIRLAETLDDPDRGPAACRRLSDRYRVVLVDEFQDTDPVQWRVLRSAFGAASETSLVLIGDPKQAIYAFRGADVYAYLDAVNEASSHYTLTENWRADQPLIDATEALLSPLQFGHQEIPFRTVRAPEHRQASGLGDGSIPQPIRFRLVSARQRGVKLTPKQQLLQKESLEEWIASDVATDIAAFLSTTKVDGRTAVAADVSVLTRTNRQAALVRDLLRQAGIPAVIAGIDSVFASDAAAHWLRLLEALQEPASPSRASAVALTPFVGMTATEVATASDRRWEEVHDRLHRWVALLATGGVGTLFESIVSGESLPGRVLGVVGGERLYTDLDHVAELLHAQAQGGQLGAPALRAWLAARIEAAGSDQTEADERSRRLDSDAEAVQVLTVHRAKGLEFGIVYCPFLWDQARSSSDSGPVLFHDPSAGSARTLDVGCPARGGLPEVAYKGHVQLGLAEQRGEDLRLLYVALTRARHQVVVWWGRAQGSKGSPLGRLLLRRNPDTGQVSDPQGQEPSDDQVRKALEAVAAKRPDLISIEPAGSAVPTPVHVNGAGARQHPARDLEAAVFSRQLDLSWRRSSYSGITASLHLGPGGTVTSEPDGYFVDDEPEGVPDGLSDGVGDGVPGGFPNAVPGGFPDAVPGGVPRGVPGGASDGVGDGVPAGVPEGVPDGVAQVDVSPGEDWPASPLSSIPGGTAFGTYVHRLLECADFTAAELRTELSTAAINASQWIRQDLDETVLVEGLEAALTTPLDPLLPAVRLADVKRADRLDELTFELPLVGGDSPSGTLRTADIARVLSVHLPGDDPLAGYARSLEDPVLAADLRGFLTGSIDIVFRRGDRWYLADYKTNRLGGGGRDLMLWDYRPEALEAEMRRRHYPLQALLYLVALHRYLAWRQRGYDPDRHLGGVLYLFLRGMAGADSPMFDGHRSGVFSWAPPASLVVALSDLFDSGAEADLSDTGADQ